MNLEIEAKLKIDSHELVRQRLAELSATFVSHVLETNVIYDSADGLLRASGRALRVRHCETLKGQPVASTLTFKGPRQPGPFKSRPEVETVIEDPPAAETILVELGYVVRLRFQKRRETWKLNRCTIALDELPYLGLFVEIEGPDADVVTQLQQQLKLGDTPHTESSYPSMLANHCTAAGIDLSDIRFK